jgi:DNA-binding transcriptional LysR family regulator
MTGVIVYIKRVLVYDWFHMETNRLKQFCTIVETGNLRKAADLLRISHSGLSKSMKALQDETGLTLFVPVGRGIVISDDGKMLYQRCAGFFGELDRLLGKGSEKRADTIRIGSFEVFTSYFIGRLMKEYFQEFEVEIHELVPGKLEEALLLHKIDIGITYEPIPRPGIEYVKVTALEMGAFAKAGRFSGRDALEIPFAVPVSPLEGAPSGVRGRDGWPDERFNRKAPFRMDLMTTGLELVHQGLCAIFIPKFVATLHNEDVKPDLKLESIPLPKGFGTVRRDVFIVKRESMEETKAVRQLAKALRKICS